MGVFSRFKDIISANLNSMLDQAEDPEKMIRLMLREMEETLVEIKSSCAGTMAERAKVGRELDAALERAAIWDRRAGLAVDRGRDDLAREALLEKRRASERAESLRGEADHLDELVSQCQGDIGRLEEKLASTRERQRLLTQRHLRAQGRKRAGERWRAPDASDAMQRFESFERRIERMEAEADLGRPGGASGGSEAGGAGRSLDDEFRILEHDGDLERELAELRERRGRSGRGD